MSSTVKQLAMGLIGLTIMLGSTGCSKSADEKKPVADVRTEAKSMDANDLRDTAMVYKKAILAKEEDAKKLGEKLKGMSISDALGKEAEALKKEASELSKSVSALTERFNIYLEELKSKNGDLSGLELP